MPDTQMPPPPFPNDLVEWAGHHSGGVKRLFDSKSGRPGKDLLRTSLIFKLESWSQQIAAQTPGTPRLLLLVGGPGNGKTEAIEHTIHCIDKELAADKKLVNALARSFLPEAGKTVPRIVDVDAGSLASPPRKLELRIVQDASTTAGHEGKLAPQLLIEELLAFGEGQDSQHYLCCVNRGVLDDALIYSIDNNLLEASALLEAVTRSVSLSAKSPSCWPLTGFPYVAVWPMDAESLMMSPGRDLTPPASLLLEHVTRPDSWPISGKCAAGTSCPFCHSKDLLSNQENRTGLLQVLRWYELSSGKRWSFRDLFSLLSYLLAGNRPTNSGQQGGPCDWAKHTIEQDKVGQAARLPSRQQLTGVFRLAASGYQHALFHRWDAESAGSLRQGIKDLGLEEAGSETRALLGLQYFLEERKDSYLPATISSLLDNVVDLLDPALASPNAEVRVSARRHVLLGELDSRFSRSLSGGLDFVHKFPVLSPPELDLLGRLAKSDNFLSSAAVRRKNPAAASRIQRIIRDFACRLVRRSICTLSAVVADAKILQAFQQVVEDDQKGERLFEVAKQVKNLLNNGQDFEISLTTTFGQPLPPQERQATLIVPARQVRVLPLSLEGRPKSPICFLEVGSGQSSQAFALTYDLFKAVKELEQGLSPAALPRTVIALLDTTKARLSGPIVRDPEVLLDARIRIGSKGTEIGRAWSGFVALKGGVRT
jgi:hypothetical protein